MINKISEAVIKLRDEFLSNEIYNKPLHFVILINPKSYTKLREEIGNNERIHTIAGIEVFIVLRSDIPENTDFVVMTKENYERIEQQEIQNKVLQNMFKNNLESMEYRIGE